MWLPKSDISKNAHIFETDSGRWRIWRASASALLRFTVTPWFVHSYEHFFFLYCLILYVCLFVSSLIFQFFICVVHIGPDLCNKLKLNLVKMKFQVVSRTSAAHLTNVCVQTDNTTQHNSTIFNWFWAADYDCVLGFFTARHVTEIILNESSKNTEYALIEWLRKEITRYFTKN
jgi:hypothetical protein